MFKVVLPELGEGIEDAVLAEWHVKVGDKVKAEDDIAEVVTDKATFHIPAGKTGVIKEIFFAEDQKVKIGEVLASINT